MRQPTFMRFDVAILLIAACIAGVATFALFGSVDSVVAMDAALVAAPIVTAAAAMSLLHPSRQTTKLAALVAGVLLAGLATLAVLYGVWAPLLLVYVVPALGLVASLVVIVHVTRTLRRHRRRTQ